MTRKLHLLIIDPQNDFCDLPPAYRPLDPATGAPHAPALPVPGAHADMQRLARLIAQGGQGLSAISITLDSHHRFDIAHPTFWNGQDGQPVAPFTEITAAQVRDGRFAPRDPANLARALNYLDRLEAAGRYTLMVWPVHCEIGSWGHNVHPDVRAAYNGWEDRTGGMAAKLAKGANPWTEHYSAVMAEVPYEDDPATEFNTAFVDMLAAADEIYVAGEAGSHCVKATVEHIADYFGADASKLVLLTDCISPVTGFDAHYQQFLQAMQARGVRLMQSGDVLPALLANSRS
jgi:nicotinamidase/pyrazinamidase